ncbi:MAG TPA: GAF domain-containing protein [Levilinea sp.]|nr:GAF domain-containing protein [Levilinea sp.]
MQTQPAPLSAEEQICLQAQLLNVVEHAVLALDLTGHILFWNRFAETFYGWTAAEVQGRLIGEVFAAPLLMEAARANLEQLRRGEGWSGEFLVQRRDSTNLKIHFSASFFQIEPRTLISMIGTSLDGMERQPIQEANRLLAEASAQLVDTVDYEAPLMTLAQLAVPQLADWCAVHLLQADGSIEQVAIAPAEMVKLKAIYDWLKNHLPQDDAAGLPAVLRSGEPKLVTDVTADFWAAAAAIKSYMIVPLIARPQTLGAVTFVTAESGRRFDQNTLALAENLASHIAIYVDKVRLYQESQRLNAELEQRVSERTKELSAAVAQLKQSEATIQALFRISNKLNATLEVSTILDELAQEAIHIVNGESGLAGLRTTEGMTIRKYFRQGAAIPFEYTWPLGEGIPGWVLQHKVPYGTSDAANDPVMQHDLAINADVRSIICTPILDSVGEVLGYFDIRNKQDGEGFTISDQEMLMALAPAASIAIQNAVAYQMRLATVAELKESSRQLQALAANLELAREEERTQIARELHDQLGQALTAMKYDLAWLTDRLVQKDATLAQNAKAITMQMDTMIKTVRRISTELRPGMLDDLGLAASIEWQARDFEKRTGIVCEVSVPAEDLLLGRAQSIALFRIFQESLTNIVRHASAQHIEVALTRTPEGLTLQVHDDGRGIQKQEIAGLHSLGLLGMRERAKRLGGTFDIQGVPGDGTIVTVSIPIQESE